MFQAEVKKEEQMDTTEVKSEASEEKPADASSEEQVRAQFHFAQSRQSTVSQLSTIETLTSCWSHPKSNFC